MKHAPSRPHLVRLIAATSLAATTLVALTTSAYADMFRWEGPNGRVHYGDTLPPQQASHGYEVINPATGEVIQTIEPAKTQAQLAAEAEAKKAETQRQKEQEERQRHDQVLLDLYSSVDDIKRARDARLTDIDQQIKQAKGAIGRSEKRANDKNLPSSVRSDAKKDIQSLKERVQDLMDQRHQVQAKFEADIKRYEQIKH